MFEKELQSDGPVTLSEVKELTTKRKVIEESVNKTSKITDATAREMCRGLTSACEQVTKNYSSCKTNMCSFTKIWLLLMDIYSILFYSGSS